MRRTSLLLLLLATSLPLRAQITPNDRPSVIVSKPTTVLDVKAENICKVDFRNISLKSGYATVRLKDGTYVKQEDRGGYQEVQLVGAICFAPVDGVPQYSVVVSKWSYSHGHSNASCTVQVYKLADGHPSVVQQLDFSCYAYRTGARFDPKRNLLTVRARTNDDSPQCCPKTLDVVEYSWDKDAFEELSFQRIPAPVQKSDQP